MVVSIVAHDDMYRVRMVNRFKVFEYSNVSALSDQGSVRDFAASTCDRILLFRVTANFRCRTYGLRIKRTWCFDLTGRVFKRVLGLVVDQGFNLVIGSIFRLARRPQISFNRFISTFGTMSFFRYQNSKRGARIYQINRFLVRIFGFDVIVSCRAVRALACRAGAFLGSFFRETTCERSFARELRTKTGLT